MSETPKIKKGYLPTAMRKIVRPEDRKGSEKRREALRKAALASGAYVDLRKAPENV